MYSLQSFPKPVSPITLSLPNFVSWADRSVITTYFHSTFFETSAKLSHKLSSGNAIALQFYQLAWLNSVREALKLSHTINFSCDKFSCAFVAYYPCCQCFLLPKRKMLHYYKI